MATVMPREQRVGIRGSLLVPTQMSQGPVTDNGTRIRVDSRKTPPESMDDLLNSSSEPSAETVIKSNQVFQRRRQGPLLISTINKDEPIVTRRELWSYYCLSSLPPCHRRYALLIECPTVYYNGDNVRVANLPMTCSARSE